ncbi:MAG TPA: hypothetical protein VGU44_02045, partial [Gammaproteobacteria bacterium]|nr:hypothetical protein [Gammaproteobacteria bacterium]
APGNPVEFKIVIGIRPEITLPNYKKIAKESLNIPDKEEDKIEATEKDIDNVVEEIRGRHAHDKYHILNKEAGHDHNDEEINKLKPEFTDDFVKTIGNFESVTDFRVKAKENVIKEKEARLKDKKRSKILEQLIAEITIILPQALIDNELNRMFSQFEADVSGVGLKLEDYLKHIKKTPEELAKDWKPDAEKRAKLNLILEDIATKEKIQPEPEEVKKEVEHLTAHYKDVDPLRASLYVEHMLRIEKTINFLENQK